MSNLQRSTIVVIEDNIDIQEMIAFNLRQEGHRVFCSSTGEDGLTKIKTKRPNIILLDWMLPGMDGIEVCRSVRADKDIKGTKVIMLTAKSEESNMLQGLNTGADDYVTKPFSTKVLMAKVNSMVRREAEFEKEEIEADIDLGFLRLSPSKREVWIDGQTTHLTTSEFKALHLLSQKPGWVISRTQIIEALHGPGHVVSNRAIDVMMVSLRKKLGPYTSYLRTVRGAGYALKVPQDIAS